ncbi:tetratricopeptide repeat protein [Glacieibacterium sp.]|uniref:tetratricopeptide repeat protein n=1 Tax=Glacieibacterium sp. TaxID=2860237 RepID=UPI003B00E096
MNFVKSLALAASVPALMMAMAPAGAAVSSAVGKPLTAASKAAASGNTAAAIASVNAARTAAKTPEERSKVGQMAAYVYTKAGQYGKAATELEALGAPPKQLAQLYYNAGNLDKAVSYARKAGGDDMQVLIAQAAARQGRYGEAVTAYNNLIKTNGPKPAYLENLSAAQYKSGDKKGYIATTTRLIKIDPSPARWKTLLVNMRQGSMSADAKLALYHLMSQTNTIDRNEDYLEFAKLALVAGQSGTARDVLAKAGTTGTDAMSQRLAQAATQRAAASAAQAPKLVASPATALQGAQAYLGLGQYPQAIAAYDKVIAAGGGQADQARIYKGIAQVRAGQIGPAKASFAAITDASEFRDIGNMWALYTSTKG